ncbi:MAG: hypothetical protein SFT90_01870 [Rickettsiales bacterium]|nr:hypothetical protein [Rickettsiales bacterium]
MFDLSIWEILIVILGAIIFLKPEDFPVVIRAVAKIFRKIKNFSAEIYNLIFEDEIIKDVVKTTKIIGDDGKEHIAYDVNEILSNDKNNLKK